MNNQDHIWNMNLALEEAQRAYKLGEVPVGAVLVSPDGKVESKGINLKESQFDPCGHAEICALRDQGEKLKNWRLTGHTLYVTLEPCAMCLGAMIQARIQSLVFGAYDPKGGAISLGYNLHKDSRLNHNFSVVGGVRHFECSQILSQFFREKRAGHLGS